MSREVSGMETREMVTEMAWLLNTWCWMLCGTWGMICVQYKRQVIFDLQKHHNVSLKTPSFLIKILMILLFCRSAEFCIVSPQHSSVLPSKHLITWRTLFFPHQTVMCTPSVSPWKSKKMMEKAILGNQNGKGKAEISLEKAHSYFAHTQLLCCNKIHLTSFHEQNCCK